MTSEFWKASPRDKVKNGVFLGTIFGLLVASSSITWIQSIVTAIVNIIPEEYHVSYIKYLVFAFIGSIVGYATDKW